MSLFLKYNVTINFLDNSKYDISEKVLLIKIWSYQINYKIKLNIPVTDEY